MRYYAKTEGGKVTRQQEEMCLKRVPGRVNARQQNVRIYLRSST